MAHRNNKYCLLRQHIPMSHGDTSNKDTKTLHQDTLHE